LDDFHAVLLREFGRKDYRSLRSLWVKSVDGSVVTLAIPTPFLGFWIERNYMEGLVRVARSLYGEGTERVDEGNAVLQAVEGQA
jgi:hypothetical protein